MTDYLKDSQPLNQHGHFPGCAVHGCEVTRCAEYRARSGFPRRDYITLADDLEELVRLRVMRDGLLAWRADVEAATLDHGWQIIARIDALLAPKEAPSC